MLAAYAARTDQDDPLSGLEVGQRPEPAADGPPDWVTVDVRAATLNHHDLWSLRGVGLPADRLPMILGCDAAGLGPDGTPVVVHSVVGDPAAGAGDETLDPKRSLLSEVHPGTLAERVAVPARNLVPMPEGMSFAEAACLPTAYLTAYRMLFTKAQVSSGDSVLVQGSGGGVATAAIQLAVARGCTVFATSRDERKRKYATSLGATALEPGARLPMRVDAAIETVGEATFEHSLKSLRPGGRLVTSGATAGYLPRVDLRRVFFLQLEILGSTMGTRDELGALIRFCAGHEVRPVVAASYPLSEARGALEQLASGDVLGKIVVLP